MALYYSYIEGVAKPIVSLHKSGTVVVPNKDRISYQFIIEKTSEKLELVKQPSVRVTQMNF